MKNLLFFLLLISTKCISQVDVSTWKIVKTDSTIGIVTTYTTTAVKKTVIAVAVYNIVTRGQDGYWYEELTNHPLEHYGKESDRVLIEIFNYQLNGLKNVLDLSKWYEFIPRKQLY